MSDQIVLTVRIPVTIHELLRNKAFTERTSINQIINNMLERELEKWKQ